MAIVIVQIVSIVVALGGLILLIAARRAGPPAAETDPSRRAFLNRTWLGSIALFAIVFGGASLASLWPQLRDQFGTKIRLGRLDDLMTEFRRSGGRPIWIERARLHLIRYDPTDANTDPYVRQGVAVAGLMALYQRCPHLGCRVPFCPSSGWFECPCHGARFNSIGELMDQPSPHGMWRFPLEIAADGSVIADTERALAPDPGDLVTAEMDPAGEYCVASAD